MKESRKKSEQRESAETTFYKPFKVHEQQLFETKVIQQETNFKLSLVGLYINNNNFLQAKESLDQMLKFLVAQSPPTVDSLLVSFDGAMCLRLAIGKDNETTRKILSLYSFAEYTNKNNGVYFTKLISDFIQIVDFTPADWQSYRQLFQLLVTNFSFKPTDKQIEKMVIALLEKYELYLDLEPTQDKFLMPDESIIKKDISNLIIELLNRYPTQLKESTLDFANELGLSELFLSIQDKNKKEPAIDKTDQSTNSNLPTSDLIKEKENINEMVEEKTQPMETETQKASPSMQSETIIDLNESPEQQENTSISIQPNITDIPPMKMEVEEKTALENIAPVQQKLRPAFQLKKLDIKHALTKANFKNAEDYDSNIYTFDEKLMADLQLPKDTYWIIPKSFLMIVEDNAEGLEKIADAKKRAALYNLPAYICDKDGNLVDKKSQIPLSSLMFACYLGKEKCIERLSQYKTLLKQSLNPSGWTPLNFLLLGYASDKVVNKTGILILSKMDADYDPSNEYSGAFRLDKNKLGFLHYMIIRNAKGEKNPMTGIEKESLIDRYIAISDYHNRNFLDEIFKRDASLPPHADFEYCVLHDRFHALRDLLLEAVKRKEFYAEQIDIFKKETLEKASKEQWRRLRNLITRNELIYPHFELEKPKYIRNAFPTEENPEYEYVKVIPEGPESEIIFIPSNLKKIRSGKVNKTLSVNDKNAIKEDSKDTLKSGLKPRASNFIDRFRVDVTYPERKQPENFIKNEKERKEKFAGDLVKTASINPHSIFNKNEFTIPYLLKSVKNPDELAVVFLSPLERLIALSQTKKLEAIDNISAEEFKKFKNKKEEFVTNLIKINLINSESGATEEIQEIKNNFVIKGAKETTLKEICGFLDKGFNDYAQFSHYSALSNFYKAYKLCIELSKTDKKNSERHIENATLLAEQMDYFVEIICSDQRQSNSLVNIGPATIQLQDSDEQPSVPRGNIDTSTAQLKEDFDIETDTETKKYSQNLFSSKKEFRNPLDLRHKINARVMVEILGEEEMDNYITGILKLEPEANKKAQTEGAENTIETTDTDEQRNPKRQRTS